MDLNIKHIIGNTYEGRVYEYVKTSFSVPRPFVLFNWDAYVDTMFLVTQINISGVTRNEYFGTGVLPAPGVYNFSCADSTRINSIQNINGSGQEHLKITYRLTDNNILGPNSSPVLSNLQTAYSQTNGTYTFNSNAFDPDGDSLVYSLVPCLTSNYSFPTTAVIDPVTGDFSMTPTDTGYYSVAIQIEEYRLQNNQYYLMGKQIRDMIFYVNYVVGINEISNDLHFSLSPNPFIASTTLSIHPQINERLMLTIYNSLGELVRTTYISGNTAEVQRGNLSSGIYYFQLTSQGARNQMSGKFIIQ